MATYSASDRQFLCLSKTCGERPHCVGHMLRGFQFQVGDKAVAKPHAWAFDQHVGDVRKKYGDGYDEQKKEDARNVSFWKEIDES